MSELLRPSIKYIPEELAGEALYQTACTMIDGVRRRAELDVLHELDEVVRGLLPNYEDERGVLAYYNMFVRPALGTKSALLFVLRLLNIDANLVEWFDADFTLPSYKFLLDFAEFPDTLDLDKLIDLVELVKNERSKLAIIRQREGFQDLFRLDSSKLDSALIGSVSGEDYRGVTVFLTKKHRTTTVVPQMRTNEGMIGITGQTIRAKHQFGWLLDSFRLDAPVENRVVDATRSSSSSQLIDLSKLTRVSYRRAEVGSSFFTLNSSKLDGSQFFGISVRSIKQPPEHSNYIEALLDDDLILDGITYTGVHEQYERRTRAIPPAAFTPKVSSSITSYYDRSMKDDFITTVRANRISIVSQTLTIPRYGVGVSTGSSTEYKPAVSYTRRSL